MVSPCCNTDVGDLDKWAMTAEGCRQVGIKLQQYCYMNTDANPPQSYTALSDSAKEQLVGTWSKAYSRFWR